MNCALGQSLWPPILHSCLEVCTADPLLGVVHTQYDGGWQMYQGGWDLPRRCAVLICPELAGHIEAVQELSHGVMVNCRLQNGTLVK
eukprot:5404321-Amphidinium_carterae.1